MGKDFLENYLTKQRSMLFWVVLLAVAGAVWGIVKCWPEPAPPLRPVLLLINRYPLTSLDKDFFRQANPYGFLLGLPSRTDLDPRTLRKELEQALGRKDFLFFIDQEGGKVNRIKQYDPSFRAPAPATFGKQAEKDLAKAEKAVYEYGLRTGQFLKSRTIDVVFAPLAEQMPQGENAPLKSRYFSSDIQVVKTLADAYARGLADGGVIPCYKHAVGDSAVSSDPHYEQQTVTLPQQEIISRLLVPFSSASDWPFLMTAHAHYTAIDPKTVSTYSPAFYRFVRQELNFDGFIIPDALNMYASEQTGFLEPAEQMNRAFAAGADIVIPLFNLDADPGWMLEQLKRIDSRHIRRFQRKLAQQPPLKAGANTLPAEK